MSLSCGEASSAASTARAFLAPLPPWRFEPYPRACPRPSLSKRHDENGTESRATRGKATEPRVHALGIRHDEFGGAHGNVSVWALAEFSGEVLLSLLFFGLLEQL